MPSTTSTIRAFLAIQIEEAVRQEIIKAQSALKACGARVSWTAPENIHMTLVFIGDVFETAVAPIGRALDTLVNPQPPYSLAVKGIGYFGRPHSPRIIWVGAEGETAPLISLQQQLVTALKNLELSPDAKPFTPHLTIGRVRSSHGAKELIAALEEYKAKEFGRLDIDRIVLMKSTLTPTGPIYQSLHASQFKSPGAK